MLKYFKHSRMYYVCFSKNSYFPKHCEYTRVEKVKFSVLLRFNFYREGIFKNSKVGQVHQSFRRLH